MTGLVIDQNAAQPVSLQSFDMAIRNYENFVKDSSYFLRFDSIRFRENRVLLSNFSVNTEPYKDKRNIQVRQFVLSELSWADLLFDRRIVAKQALLIRPVIDYYPSATAKPRTRNPIVNSLAGINNFMDLDRIQIENGRIKIKTRRSVDLRLEDANVIINSSKISNSVSFANAEGSIELLNFKKGIMKTPGLVVNMDNAYFDGLSNKFLFGHVIVYDHQQSFNINATNIKLDSLVYIDSLKMLNGKGISWQKADIEINMFGKEKKNGDDIDILLRKVQGNNTQVYLNNAKSSLSVFLNAFSLASLDKKEKTRIDGLRTDGKQLYWFSKNSSLSASNFSLADHTASSINDLHFKQMNADKGVDIKAAAMSFTPDVNSMIKESALLQNVKIKDPLIYIRTGEKSDSSDALSLPFLSVDQLELQQPVFSLENSATTGTQRIDWDGRKTDVLLKNVKVNEANGINIGSLNTTISDFSFTSADNQTTRSKEGSLKVQLSDIQLKPGKKLFWAASANEIIAKNFSADSVGNKPTNIKVYEGVIKNLRLGSEITGSIKELIKKNPAFTVSDISGQIIDDNNKWDWYDLSFSKAGKSFSIDSFSFHPVKDRDEFVASHKFQTDYMTIKTGKVTVSKFDLDQYLEDSVFLAGNVNIDQPYFTSYRDKRPPFNAGIIKPLPAKLIQRIPFKISVDTIVINNGTAVYTELNDKTNETAVIPITRMSGDIFPIRNFGLTDTDTFRIRLNGYLLDSGWIRLRTRESFLDTASGFLITLRMRPHSMLYLNQILPALSSVKLTSGYLDTLTMRAIGKEYLALGEMRMNYHDLKVQFLKNGKEDKRTFLQGLKTFIANSFIIKNENKKRVGVVYFPRWRDRSFINYYIKIAMSGVASSVGAKKNKRLAKRYSKQLKVRQLPGYDLD